MSELSSASTDALVNELSRRGALPARTCGRPEPSEAERVKRAEACIAEVERLADLDVRCPCCTGYGNILDAIATYQNGADHDD